MREALDASLPPYDGNGRELTESQKGEKSHVIISDKHGNQTASAGKFYRNA
jgi:hypothetical protein